MKIQMTPREINDKKWEEHWKSMQLYLKNHLPKCLFVIDDHALGIHFNGRCYQIYGATDSYVLEDNRRVIIKAENKKTGKFVKVYDFNKEEKTLKQGSQAYLFYKNANQEQVMFVEELTKNLVNFYKPNSIKFILD